MDVVLIYAPSAKQMIPYPPAGIGILAGALMKCSGVSVKLFDLEMVTWNMANNGGDVLIYKNDIAPPDVFAGENIEIKSFGKVLFDLCDLKSGDGLGISVMGYPQLASTLMLIDEALEKGVRVILGGQFWTESSAENLLKHYKSPDITVVMGDGWNAIRKWVQNTGEIPYNSCIFRDGEILKGEFIDQVSEAPLPNYDTLNWDLYTKYLAKVYGSRLGSRAAHLYVSDKSCPYKCNFCRVSRGSKSKMNTVDNIAASMKNMLDSGVRQFNTLANELNPSLAYMRNVVGQLKVLTRGYENVGWFTYLRPDYMEKQDLIDLREAGCRMIRFGVETGSQRLLDKMEKGYKIETIIEVLKKSSEAGIVNHVNFIVGYPGEQEEDIAVTLKFIEKNKDYLHSARINPFYLSPDTPMSENPEKYNIRLVKFNMGYWEFEYDDGRKVDRDTIKNNIKRIVNCLLLNNIGFAGVVPFFLLNYLMGYSDRDEALANLRRTHGFLWESIPSDQIKARLGRFKVNTDWDSTICKRGNNYNINF